MSKPWTHGPLSVGFPRLRYFRFGHIAHARQLSNSRTKLCSAVDGHPVRDLQQLSAALSEFAGRAAEKLRRQDSVAGRVLVFAHASPFRPGPRWSQSLVVPLRRPTADTRLITQAAVMGIELIYQPDYDLAKAGVMLLDLSGADVLQGELDLEDDAERDRGKVMSAVDAINLRFGKSTIHTASTGTATDRRDWMMRQDRRTPHYTTDWKQIPTARA